MDDATPHTTQLHRWLDRLQAGDLAARNELLSSVGQRLERLARKMLRSFPSVGRWEQTDDVLQNALLRLIRSLHEVRPDSMRAFYGLAAQQMRRELLDLARHYNGPLGEGANQVRMVGPDDSSAPGFEPAAPPDNDLDLQRWAAFHREVERLPVLEREVVGLVFYHGWTQAEVAELLGITDRTVRRHWTAAMAKLHGALQAQDLEP